MSKFVFSATLLLRRLFHLGPQDKGWILVNCAGHELPAKKNCLIFFFRGFVNLVPAKNSLFAVLNLMCPAF